MRNKGRKYSKERVARAAINLLAPKEDKKPALSGKRLKIRLASIILFNFHFSTKHARLIKALARKPQLDLFDIQVATKSKTKGSAKVLVRSFREKLRSDSVLKQHIDVGGRRIGKKYVYFLKIVEK